MGRARVVAPPPEDYIPEPLVSTPAPPPVEEKIVQEWIDGNFEEQIVEIAQNEPSEEELEKERIAQQRYEEIRRQKEEEANRLAKIEEQKKLELEEAEKLKEEIAKEKDRLAAIAHEQLLKNKQKTDEEQERIAKLEEERKLAIEAAEKAKRELEEEKDRLAAIAHAKLQEAKKVQEVAEEPASRKKPEKKEDAKLKAELDALRAENERLAREKEAAEKAREQQIVAMRNKATEQRGNQLNMVKQRKPSLWARFQTFLKRKRIELATVGIKNYETAIIQRARIAVPKMLDDIEKMHEQLTILEELLAKHKEREKIKD